MTWLCSITLVVNPKDLNKNKGLKLSPLFLFIYWSYLYVSTCAIPLFRMAQEVKYSLFHGRERTSSLSKQGSQKVRNFLGRGRTPATPTSQASSLLQGRSDEVLLWCPRQCLTCSTHWALRMIWLCSITLVVNPKDLNKDRGLTKWVLYFYLPYWFPKSSYMMFLLLSFEWVQEVKHSLGHHRRTAQVVLDVLWSIVLLEVGVTPSSEQWSLECTSHNECINLSIWTVLN